MQQFKLSIVSYRSPVGAVQKELSGHMRWLPAASKACKATVMLDTAKKSGWLNTAWPDGQLVAKEYLRPDTGSPFVLAVSNIHLKLGLSTKHKKNSALETRRKRDTGGLVE